MEKPAEIKASMICLIRSIHGLITLFFLVCIGYIYYSAITDKVGLLAYLAVASVVFEGLTVVFNKGICPLGSIHKKFGDDKTFFELFLPKSVAAKAVPFLGMVAAIGILWLFL